MRKKVVIQSLASTKYLGVGNKQEKNKVSAENEKDSFIMALIFFK